MFRTGNNYTDYLSLVVIYFPLIPVILILFQKNYHKEPFGSLLLICLLDFLQTVIPGQGILQNANKYTIINGCSLLEMVLLLHIFKSSLPRRIKDAMNILLLIFISVYITYFSVKGWAQPAGVFEVIQSLIIMCFLLISLPTLIRDTGLKVFESALFWITTGTLVYFFFNIILGWVDYSSGPSSRNLQAERTIFLDIASLIRYGLYLLAILLFRERKPAGAEEEADGTY